MASNFIALELGHEEIRVATSQLQGKHVRIRSAFAVSFAEDDTDEQIGEKLKSELAQHGMTRGDALVVVSRSEVEIREITVPPAPENELPSLVRFKSKSEFATATDNWSIDFIPLSGTESTERELFATALSGKVSDRLKLIAETANLKLKHIVLRPCATQNLLIGEIDDDGILLVVAPNGDEIDLSLIHAGKLILTRTVRSNAHGETDRLAKQLTLEVQRTLASATKRIGNKSVDKVIICGNPSHYQTVGQAVTERAGAETTYIDPFAKLTLKGEVPSTPERYSSLIGALMQQGMGRKHAIDFLNPRQPVVEGNKNNARMLLAGLVAAVLLIGGFLGWMTLRSQQQKIDSLTKRLAEIKTENSGQGDVKGVEQVIGEVELVDQWLARAPNWLDELEELSNRTLDPDRVIVDKFLGSIGNQSPFVNLKGRVKEHATNTDLQMDLAGRPYTVGGKGTNRSAKSVDYPFSMEQDLKITVDLAQKQEELDEIAATTLNNYNATQDEPESLENE